MKQAHIIGLGRSGIAAARVLKQQGWQVELSDRATHTNLHPLRDTLQQEGITVSLGASLDLNAPHPDLLVVSPGVPWDSPTVVQARAAGIDTLGEMELAWRQLNRIPWVGITGTNGKTTTTALTAAIFRQAGLQAPACGNIGHAACELALINPSKTQDLDWVIAEISSYQIEAAATLAPRIGLWTTFTPDHLARHYTLENYYAIKASLLARSQSQIFNGDDPYLRDRATDWPRAHWTSVTGPAALPCKAEHGIYLEKGEVIAFGERVMTIGDLKMLGDHNQQNLLMAVGAARLAGIAPEAIAAAVREFPGVPHRLEYLCTHEGVTFINDSKATNYDASLVGLTAVPTPTILIAGGDPKAGDDQAWLGAIAAKAAAVVLIGDAAPQFAARLAEVGYTQFEQLETLDQAVPRSLELAKHHGASTVLLSPACASFDQYSSFEHRGDHFRQLCTQLAAS
ncbi:UDP-N-acetylmuramoyl-L-alanine--D-glutamate ligase [Spirulina major CS-329]|uniref:UDP-N-acetylmuramoyl-L-alanine--D-glutamate ligase n=1 Tax=Spirulina TaxID=1154 RepID=UPI00232B8D2A|nr:MULTISPECIES: UDP-N-acetylmuramoyl-L-alanine--D-glutamate ligase [Spirulina]MDB9493843.1 UDP-N-acetylmuramoyl-L-alanine--D-glutamate ligase [Spirulina subsalsa CS-330]MDB9504694.1 UDP-N-acetylmuramoyl-L-alanine--D-glutamate ligase [Spirulina major CS-329]